MYRSDLFKELLSYDKCLCSDRAALEKYIGDTKDFPAKTYL